MNDLVKNQNDIICRETACSTKYHKILNIKPTSLNVDFKGIINKICQYTNILEVVDSLEKGAEFIVDIPTEFKEGYEAGEYFLMENKKNGKIWPTLMKVGDDGKNEIVKPLAIKKEEFLQGNPAKDIADNFHNIYMQQQMNKLINIAEETYENVEKIEHGQMDDRIAMIETGKQQMILALSQKDDASRSTAVQLAINNITVGQKQVFETLKRKAKEFKPLPKTKVMRVLKEATRGGYLSKMDNEYEELVEYYKLYLDSTKMLAAAYAIFDDSLNAEQVFDMAASKISEIDFSKVRTIEYEHPTVEKVYDDCAEYLLAEKEICLQDAKEYDCLSLSMTKEDFLEAVEYGKQEEVSK